VVSLVNARETIYQRFVDQWGTTTPYVFDNEAYSAPVESPWVRIAVRHAVSTLETIGGIGVGGVNTFQRTGIVFAQVFTPLDQGLYQADVLSQQVRAIFEGVTLSSNAIRFTNAEIREIGPSENWYLTNVQATFQYDERK
jgi:hypothetical protein